MIRLKICLLILVNCSAYTSQAPIPAMRRLHDRVVIAYYNSVIDELQDYFIKLRKSSLAHAICKTDDFTRRLGLLTS